MKNDVLLWKIIVKVLSFFFFYNVVGLYIAKISLMYVKKSNS